MQEKPTSRPSIDYEKQGVSHTVSHETHASGVSWSAVFAGAAATAALSLILLALGAGLGLSSVSLRSNVGVSASTIGASAILWLILAEVLSSSMGGYLAGRLRTKWSSIHIDEVYFRDTAHGFLAWSVALVTSAAFLASASTSLMGGSASSESHRGASMTTQAPGGESGTLGYFSDSLLRAGGANPDGATAAAHSEVEGILSMSLAHGSLSTDDRNYLGQVVSRTAGIGESDANKRVTDTFTAAMRAAETTRKSIAHTLLWAFLALLIGAFCASFSATLGGRQRDNVRDR